MHITLLPTEAILQPRIEDRMFFPLQMNPHTSSCSTHESSPEWCRSFSFGVTEPSLLYNLFMTSATPQCL